MNKIEFINSTGIPESLVEAVIHQFGGWGYFTESAEDVANYGIDGGFHGFIYHSDTVKFASNNLQSILAYAKDMAEDLGEDVAYSLIAGFNCLKDYTADDIADIIHLRESFDNGADFIQVFNALAWFAAEADIIHLRESFDNGADFTQVFNALAWFAAEEVCRAYADSMEIAA